LEGFIYCFKMNISLINNICFAWVNTITSLANLYFFFGSIYIIIK
jgi:hypothetical protein